LTLGSFLLHIEEVFPLERDFLRKGNLWVNGARTQLEGNATGILYDASGLCHLELAMEEMEPKREEEFAT
jgi:hypothetical protein